MYLLSFSSHAISLRFGQNWRSVSKYSQSKNLAAMQRRRKKKTRLSISEVRRGQRELSRSYTCSSANPKIGPLAKEPQMAVMCLTLFSSSILLLSVLLCWYCLHKPWIWLCMLYQLCHCLLANEQYKGSKSRNSWVLCIGRLSSLQFFGPTSIGDSKRQTKYQKWI